MTKIDIRGEIKALRFQMSNLEKKCQEREDKIIHIIELLEPAIAVLSPEMKKQIKDKL
jgi:hypothetical protein